MCNYAKDAHTHTHTHTHTLYRMIDILIDIKRLLKKKKVHTNSTIILFISVYTCISVCIPPKLQALVYNILPSTTAIFYLHHRFQKTN